MSALASPQPEVLISAIGAATRTMRIGSGGVMLPHYAAFKVAESFSMLAGLYPGRVDLGIGRANGSDPHTASALQRSRAVAQTAEDFPEQMSDLLGYLADDLPATHPFARLAGLLPGLPERPEPWLLGSSPQSAIWAAEMGLPYCFADFIHPYQEDIAELYRERFEPSQWLRRPKVMVAVIGVAAETRDEAWRLSSSIRMALVQLRQGRFGPLPTVERAEPFLAELGELADPAACGRRMLVGDGDEMKAQIERVAAEYQADEVMVLTSVHDPAARKRSYALLAEAFGLRSGLGVGLELAKVS